MPCIGLEWLCCVDADAMLCIVCPAGFLGRGNAAQQQRIIMAAQRMAGALNANAPNSSRWHPISHFRIRQYCGILTEVSDLHRLIL